MPTVPRAQRTVESVAIPNAYAPSPSIIQSPDFVTPTNKVFATAEQMFQEEVKKVNQVALLDADTQLSQEKLRIDLEATKFKGKDAAGAIDYATKAWDEATKRIEKGLGNDAQRLAFSGRKQSHWTELDSRTQKHAAVELRDYELKTTDAWVDNTIEWTAANRKEPGLVEGSLSAMDAVNNDFAVRNGLDSEQLKALKAKSVEKLHTAVINRMLADGDDLAAKAYFGKHSAEITDTRLREKIHEASSDGDGFRIYDTVYKAHGAKDDSTPIDKEKMIVAIQGMAGEDYKAAKVAITLLNERVAAHNESIKSRIEANTNAVLDAYDKKTSALNLYNMPEFLALPADKRQDIKDKIRGYAEHAEQRSRTISNEQKALVKVEQEITRAMLTENPVYRKSVDLDDLLRGGKLSAEGYRSIKVLDDPKRSPSAISAFKLLDDAKRKNLFNSKDVANNNASWAEYSMMLHQYIQNNPDGDPIAYAEEIMKPVETTWREALRDGWLGSRGTDAAEAKRKQELKTMAEGRGQATTGSVGLKVGDKKSGYRYVGGDPSKKENWTKL